MQHICGRMTRVKYAGSHLQQFWERCGNNRIHPDDKPFFDYAAKHDCKLACDFLTDYGPWPFDGPLDTAKVIVCYANPLYSPVDRTHRHLIIKQRTGVEPLPAPWYPYYKPRIGAAIGAEMSELSTAVSLFNVCPYPSVTMPDRSIRFASGLPSVWAAQKHLREVLIPQAQAGEIFLVMARKHQLWGVIEGFASDNIAFSRNMGGHLGPTLGGKIREWLQSQSASSINVSKAA
ncbi:MAG: hypothetical protein RJA34_1218 [Pseudomonadota bacterium]